VYVSKKFDISLIGSTYHYQVVYHQSILDTSYFIQNWESFLEGHLPTPYIIPKTDPGPITQDKSGIATKQAPPLPNVLPNPHTMRPRGSKEHQPALVEPYFASTTDFHKASLS